MRNKKKADSIISEIERCKKAIASERDKLRDLINDCLLIEESCQEAVMELESAADILSKYL